MTLILNELKLINGLSNSYWICAADRRITLNGNYVANRKKIFPIKYLNATVSFFGLAIWNINNKEYSLSNIIREFIRDNHDIQTLDVFASRLRDKLNSVTPKNLLESHASGVHLSGYNQEGHPHFIHFSNVGRMEGNTYLELLNEFKEPYADFLERDAKKSFEWDGTNPESARNGGFIYRNGDIRTHVASSEIFDKLMAEIFDLEGFKSIKNHKDHADYVLYKFDFIARLYEKWANRKVIGKPIDIYVLTPSSILKKTGNNWSVL